MLFIIMLNIMLVSWVQEPVDCQTVRNAEHKPEVPAQSEAPTSKAEQVWTHCHEVEGIEICIESNFEDSIRIQALAVTDESRFFHANFGTPSHFGFFDKSGNEIGGHGSEPRPARPLYSKIADQGVDKSYSELDFFAGKIERSYLICFYFDIATEAQSSAAMRHRVCLRRS